SPSLDRRHALACAWRTAQPLPAKRTFQICYFLEAECAGEGFVKAAVVTRYGSPDVVVICEVPKPTPAAGEVSIRVHATSVNRTDCGELRAHPFFIRFFTGLSRPRRTI